MTMNIARSLADAAMDRRLRQYLEQAAIERDAAKIADAHRALRIRYNPTFLALVDVVDSVDPSAAGGRGPERSEAVARLLDTASITLETEARRGVREAAKVAVRAIVDELGIPESQRLATMDLVLVMARDWARARAHHTVRAHLHQSARTVAS